MSRNRKKSLRNKSLNLPFLQDVIMQSSSKPSQVRGCSSTDLACNDLLAWPLFEHVFLRPHTRTGGNIAVRARGSTGCTISSSSATLPVVRFESERNRLTEPSVLVRCIFKVDDAILLRCRTEACCSLDKQCLGILQYSQLLVDATC